jgi:CRP-like cAMP-binding protein
MTAQLRAMPWIKGLKDKTTLALGKIAHRQIFQEGELIFRQHQHAHAIAIVLHGKVGVISAREEKTAEYGTLIGCSAFLTDSYRTSAKAITPTELVWLDLPNLKVIASKDKSLEQLLAEQLDREIHQK